MKQETYNKLREALCKDTKGNLKELAKQNGLSMASAYRAVNQFPELQKLLLYCRLKHIHSLIDENKKLIKAMENKSKRVYTRRTDLIK